MAVTPNSHKHLNVALGICITMAVTMFVALIADLQSSGRHFDGLRVHNPSGPRRRLTESDSGRTNVESLASSRLAELDEELRALEEEIAELQVRWVDYSSV